MKGNNWHNLSNCTVLQWVLLNLSNHDGDRLCVDNENFKKCMRPHKKGYFCNDVRGGDCNGETFCNDDSCTHMLINLKCDCDNKTCCGCCFHQCSEPVCIIAFVQNVILFRKTPHKTWMILLRLAQEETCMRVIIYIYNMTVCWWWWWWSAVFEPHNK